MFGNLKPYPVDTILSLVKAFREDPREGKIDLGVGVYKNADGVTPIMGAVKTAEKQLWELESSKSYVALSGDPAFSDVMIDLVLGESVERGKIAAAATPGGTGAIRQAFELVKMASPDARVFVSNPTWPNHVSILDYLGMEHVAYRYFDSETRSVDFDGMMADLAQAGPGDIVLVHGCCHNPTGIDPTAEEWEALAKLVAEKKLLPLFDFAYQGFAKGVEDDAAGLRTFAKYNKEILVASSFSKNFQKKYSISPSQMRLKHLAY